MIIVKKGEDIEWLIDYIVDRYGCAASGNSDFNHDPRRDIIPPQWILNATADRIRMHNESPIDLNMFKDIFDNPEADEWREKQRIAQAEYFKDAK